MSWAGLLRHGAMTKVFNAGYDPSTLGSFPPSFIFGHVRQFDAVASRFLVNRNHQTPLLGIAAVDDLLFLDVDDMIIEVHGYQKQGSGYRYAGVRGLNAFIATAST